MDIRSINTSVQAGIEALGSAGAKVFGNKYIKLGIFLLACLVAATGQEVIGAVGFVVLICLALVTSADTAATTLPFLLLSVFLTRCYDSYDTFIGYLPLAIPAVLCLVFHFAAYRKPFRIGLTFPPMLAVSLALLLGGVGCLTVAEYFKPGVLYYTFFLGVGMTVAYLLLKPRFSGVKARETLLENLYIMGLFAVFVIFNFARENWSELLETHRLPALQASNNLSTLLMFALPAPFFYAKKHPKHLICAVLMLFAMLLSGSRGGFLLGTAEFFLCLIVTAILDKKRRFSYVIGTLLFGSFLAATGGKWLETSCGVTLETLISESEVRYQLLGRAKDLFWQYPIFGHGLGYTGNDDLYNPVTGAMHWYHMIVPQVIAGLGIVGTIAYGSQFVLRCLALIKALKAEGTENASSICAVGLSWIGVLMMSLVNPGLFCPIPYALLAVMLMATVDGEISIRKKKTDSLKSPRRHAVRRPKIGE